MEKVKVHTNMGVLEAKVRNRQQVGDFPEQFQVKVKLPKGSRTGGGKKWMDYDYWYREEELIKG